MGKIADQYLQTNPWYIIEDDFNPSRSRVSESIFSLGNEYMGVRGYFEEGFNGQALIGSYFNGLYEETEIKHPALYKGFPTITRDLTNSVDWLYIRILLDDESLDLSQSTYSNFHRKLDLRTGTLSREFVWQTVTGKRLKITFLRFVSMVSPHLGCQQVSFEPLNFSGTIQVTTGLDFSPHADWFTASNWTCPRMEQNGDILAILGKTNRSNRYLFSSYRLDCNDSTENCVVKAEKFIGLDSKIRLEHGKTSSLTRIAVNYAGVGANTSGVEQNPRLKPETVWSRGMELADGHRKTQFETALAEHSRYWENVWNQLDVTIEGDNENQQGIRFCIFQLHQTYHGVDPALNIGAKGLTGEAYGGKAFWDTEAYCLQFYMFNNPRAARNLLEYRYQLLPKAVERARQLDCEGACYPISSIDGEESCGAWQHSSLQIHVSGAIAFGIFHYTRVCNDKDFLYHQGVEMLIQISRFYASRVQQNPDTLQYGFYGVMGVDEFHMMVNNNCFINYLAKKALEFTVAVIDEMKKDAPEALSAVIQKTGYNGMESEKWKQITANMVLPQNKATGVYEQHDGFFTLPHLNIDAIPTDDFPLYNHWSYDRIFRHDMIKQPDVLMMLFLYSQDFSIQTKRANYHYYEPKCIHESSLSPSIHSIIAAEIGELEEACEFFRFATRLDLDDYNRNTWEGLHITSIAAAWMNIVYGFGGMRSDGPMLAFNPSLPPQWKSYSFRILYQNAILSLSVNQEHIFIKTNHHTPVTIMIYGNSYQIDDQGLKLNFQPNTQIKEAYHKYSTGARKLRMQDE